jgi:hypothetical protein
MRDHRRRQHGHRGSRRPSECMMAIRKVTIESAKCRSGRVLDLVVATRASGLGGVVAKSCPFSRRPPGSPHGTGHRVRREIRGCDTSTVGNRSAGARTPCGACVSNLREPAFLRRELRLRRARVKGLRTHALAKTRSRTWSTNSSMVSCVRRRPASDPSTRISGSASDQRPLPRSRCMSCRISLT